MNTPAPEGGWTAVKAVALVISLIAMAGFGLCALCGVALSIEDLTTNSRIEIWPLALGLSAIGGAAAIALFFGVRAIVRSTRREPPSAP